VLSARMIRLQSTCALMSVSDVICGFVHCVRMKKRSCTVVSNCIKIRAILPTYAVYGPPTSTTVTGPVEDRLQVGNEDAPVLNCPAPLRRFHDSGAGCKLLLLLLTTVFILP